MLPIPKNSRWNGLVYLHGLLPNKPDDTALNRLVVTSGDFGLAYLTERWAARFVSELFRNYVVCFIGYSINDPVLRYMMDALAADRMLGEVTPQAWALGDCAPGQEDRKTIEWEAKGAADYVTVVDRGLTDTSAQDAYVAGDNTAFGKIPAEYIAKALNGKGNVVAMRGIATTLDNERMDAFNAVLKNHPDIKLLDAKYANWNRDDAFKVTQDDLTRFKQIDAIWAADDDMAVGVLKAIDQAKRDDIKVVFGGAGAKGMVKTIMDGKDKRIDADVSYSPKFIYDAIKLTAEARLKGEKLPATTIIPSVLITKENAKDFYHPNSPF